MLNFSLFALTSVLTFYISYIYGETSNTLNSNQTSSKNVLSDYKLEQADENFMERDKINANDEQVALKNDKDIDYTKNDNKLTKLRSSAHYVNLKKEYRNKYPRFFYDYIASVRQNIDNVGVDNSYDEELANILENQFIKAAKKNPKETFNALKDGISLLSDNPIEQANLFEKLANIPGKQEEAKELIFSNLDSQKIKPPMPESKIKSLEDQLKYYQASPEEIAFDMKHQLLLKLTKNKEELYANSLLLFNNQINQNVQRNLASDLLEKNASNLNRLVNDIGLKKANELVPPQYIIIINSYGNAEIQENFK